MDFQQAVKLLNRTLKRERPEEFSGTWVYRHAPRAYRYIMLHIRTDLDDIDWDAVICKLDKKFQERWANRRTKKVRTYRSVREVKIALKRYQAKLYVFIAPADQGDRLLRDTISIALVRVAQKGNLRAQQELAKLLHYMVDEWIEVSPRLSRWCGYGDDIDDRIRACIRCYRFTGSFIGYLFKTLEYAGRGLRPFFQTSLDEPILDGARTKLEYVVRDESTGTIKLYGN